MMTFLRSKTSGSEKSSVASSVTFVERLSRHAPQKNAPRASPYQIYYDVEH